MDFEGEENTEFVPSKFEPSDWREQNKKYKNVRLVGFCTKLEPLMFERTCSNLATHLLFGYRVTLYSKKLLRIKLKGEERKSKPESLDRFCSFHPIEEDSIVLFSDIFDVLSLRAKDEFLREFLSLKKNAKIVFSTEKNFFPFFWEEDKKEIHWAWNCRTLDHKKALKMHRSIFGGKRYINSGLFGGERETMCNLAQLINFLPNLLEGEKCVEDQALTNFAAMMLSKSVALDANATLFISARDSEFSFEKIKDNDSFVEHSVKSMKFNSHPSFIHGNGMEWKNYPKVRKRIT